MSKRITRRSKPTVAYENQKRAVSNIEVKMEVLRSLASDVSLSGAFAVAEPNADRSVLQSLPTTLRQFNAWCSGSLDKAHAGRYPAFCRNAQITLKKSGLIANVQQLVSDLQLLRKAPTPSQRREEAVAGLRRTIANANALRQIAERELLRCKRRIEELGEEAELAARRATAVERETLAQLGAARKRITDLEAQIKRQAAKVLTLPQREGRPRKEGVP